MKKKLLYFGCLNDTEHYLFIEGNNYTSDSEVTKLFQNTGINIKIVNVLDGNFAPETIPRRKEGLYSESIIQDKLRVVAWWDRSFDKTMTSNSCLLGLGYESAEEMISDAVIKFPSVMNRQDRPVKFIL